MPVRTRLLYAGRSTPRPAGYVTLYTVPTDRTLILRTLTVQNVDGSTRQALPWISAGAGVVFFGGDPALASGANYVWRDWMALQEGDVLGIYSNTDLLDITVSGSLLDGDPA